VKATKTMMAMAVAWMALGALAGGCGGAGPDGVSTPNALPPVRKDVMGEPRDGTSRGDGTGVPAHDKDPLTPHDDKPTTDKPDHTPPPPRP
jgi:hypothetical protein